MYQAITTRFLGPTNSRGSRVKAKAAAGSVVVSWDYALNPQQNHAAAAEKLARQLGWVGQWVQGGLPDEAGDVFVTLPPGVTTNGATTGFHVGSTETV